MHYHNLSTLPVCSAWSSLGSVDMMFIHSVFQLSKQWLSSIILIHLQYSQAICTCTCMYFCTRSTAESKWLLHDFHVDVHVYVHMYMYFFIACSLWVTIVRVRLLLSQVSALLGRIPSAVGYQPTLATDMGTMQERITTTKKGSITSVQVNRFIRLWGGCSVYLLF